MKRILILGSGYISSCLINFLTRVSSSITNQKYFITVASIIQKELEDLAIKFPTLTTVILNVQTDTEKLNKLVEKCDLVISLLPNNMHLPVAEVCIAFRVNMIHASYNTPELNRLNSAAKQNGVLILGELGLDPGIDHLLAMKCIHEIQEGRGKVTSFISYCGGLPAPDCAGNNPLHYKFSWAPKTALGNLLNGAKFIQNKSIVEISPGGKILDEMKMVRFLPELGLEGYPNRDSLVYLEHYGLSSASSSSQIKNFFRGSLRFAGFCSAVKGLIKLGLFSDDALDILTPAGNHPVLSWREFIAFLLKLESSNDVSLKSVLSKDEFNTLRGLGLLSDSLVDKLETPLNTLSSHLERTLKFKKGEQDVVILHHELQAKYPILSPDSVCGRKEFREIDFVVYGDPLLDSSKNSYSAMAKTVAYTLGIGSQMMLNGEIKQTGVILPLTKDIYIPILERLSYHGLFAIERISTK